MIIMIMLYDNHYKIIDVHSYISSSFSFSDRNAVCVVGGDPFYTTLDGARLEFQGKCTYQLMQTKKSLPKDLEEFTVLVNNMKALGSERSYTDKVHIDIAYHRFSLRDNGQIMVSSFSRKFHQKKLSG